MKNPHTAEYREVSAGVSIPARMLLQKGKMVNYMLSSLSNEQKKEGYSKTSGQSSSMLQGSDISSIKNSFLGRVLNAIR